MFSAFYNKMQLVFAQKANRFLFTMRNIKFLGDQISEEWYVRADVKKVLGILGMLSFFLADIFKKVCYFLLVIVLPNMVLKSVFELDGAVLGRMFMWSFFFMNCMLGSFVNSHITVAGDENDYLLLNLMRFNPKEYYLTGILWEYGRQFLYYAVILWVVLAGFQGVKPLPFLWLLGVYACFRFIGEAVRLKINDTYGIPFQDTNHQAAAYYYLYNFAMFLLAYGMYPILFLAGGEKWDIAASFSEISWISPLVLIMAVTAMVFSVRYLWRYPDYVLVARKLCSLQRLSGVREAEQAVQKSSYELQDKEVSEVELHSRMYQEKKGYDYLNAIFFRRHKRLVQNVVRAKAVISGLIFGVGAAVLLFCRLYMPAGEFMAMSGQIWKAAGNFMPTIVFIMYCASSGQNLTRAMFYNCDISLLKYGYYRTQEAILQGFRIRLKYMLLAEIPTVGIFTLGIVVNTFLLHQWNHWAQMVSMVLCACILTVFYSVVFLCMYYIFQPFTEGGEQTGIGYKVCSALLYLLSYTCLQIHTAPVFFMLLVMGVTVSVLLAAFFIAWRLAPKTFRLK